MRKIILLLIVIILPNIINSKTIYVGQNETYKSIQEASSIAKGGDTILVREGIYQGGISIQNLKGDGQNLIYIIGEPNKQIIISGGNTAIQFSEVRSIHIENIIFERQKLNGVNVDDGGTYDTPSTRIIFKNCTFRNIDATGNNDLLKLSGIDTFVVENCIFEKGSPGGSGIDMVGCHYGVIEGNKFNDMGSNAIQAKGGSQYLLIYRNFFENCGQRTLNLGGNTGLQFFRPIDAKFEASDISVWSNIFIGSISPINYVGCVNVEVINNTIIKPEKWAIRILQETVDESRFYKSSNCKFENNIVYIGNLNTTINIGPNTAPETFIFKNNLWYNYQNTNWSGPNLPTPDPNQIINVDPLFEDLINYNFRLKIGSKAIAYVNNYINPKLDFYGNQFSAPRSIGAIESHLTNVELNKTNKILIFPNPAKDYLNFSLSDDFNLEDINNLEIYDIFGKPVNYEIINQNNSIKIKITNLQKGTYFIKIGNNIEKFIKK